jgi:sodium-dependent dicarboxylate transporter 2/3/5
MPIPWAATGFLPLAILPVAGALSFGDTIGFYGQRILPFVMGVMLFGHAFNKHGLARRLAMAVLSLPGIANSGARLVLMILIVSAVVSSVVDDAATVAIMMPIALSVARFAAEAFSPNPRQDRFATPRLTQASCLAVLYGASAGGMATPAGVPFNPITISLSEQLTGYSVSFAQWTLTGIILTLATIPAYYAVLAWMSPPEVKSIKDGAAYFREQKKTLGPLSRGEKNVLFVLVVMIVLWLLPAFITVPVLDIWYVPVLAMLLLFLLPVDARASEMTLKSRDLEEGISWNVLFLVVSGTAIAGMLGRLGVTEWLGGMVARSVSASMLPWFAGLMTPLIAHVGSGTATSTMMATVLFPVAKKLGSNPTVLARIIAGTALVVTFPWAGAAAGTAFASGAVSIGAMFRIGIVATVVTVIVITVLSIVLVPALGAFSPP